TCAVLVGAARWGTGRRSNIMPPARRRNPDGAAPRAPWMCATRPQRRPTLDGMVPLPLFGAFTHMRIALTLACLAAMAAGAPTAPVWGGRGGGPPGGGPRAPRRSGTGGDHARPRRAQGAAVSAGRRRAVSRRGRPAWVRGAAWPQRDPEESLPRLGAASDRSRL